METTTIHVASKKDCADLKSFLGNFYLARAMWVNFQFDSQRINVNQKYVTDLPGRFVCVNIT